MPIKLVLSVYMNNYRLIELGENEYFDTRVIDVDSSFTQDLFYAKWQRNLGRKVRRFKVLNDEKVISFFQMIMYPLVFNRVYYYIPFGPIVTDTSDDFFVFLKNEFKKIAKEDSAVFFRFDFPKKVNANILNKHLTRSPLSTYHSAYFQPRFEWFLSLENDEDSILMNMHEKTRYSIRLAERKGIEVDIVKTDFMNYFDDFYNLMKITADRNGFSLHDREYYKVIFESLNGIKNSYLSIAKFGEKILAIDLIIVYSGIANYVFGGSSDEERNRMPTYLAQWKAIQYAKSIGCSDYNFGGISNGDSIYKGWEGITKYKMKFGGYEVRHSDFYDFVIDPMIYYLYCLRKLIKKILK